MVCGAAPATIVPSAHGKPPLQAPLADTKVSPVGVGSLSVTVAASDGPAFVTVIVYVTDVPAVACTGPLRLTCTSADGVAVTVLVPALFTGFGSVAGAATAAVAVFVSVPVAPDGIVPVARNLTARPTPRLTKVAMFPEPDAAPHTAPGSAAHVHVTPVSGTASVTVTAS